MQQDLQEHQQRAERIEALIQAVSQFPDPQARATTEELLQALLDMYGEALARILALATQAESGQMLLASLANDDLISSLLLLHGLHPTSLEERITQALQEVRPYLQSHGGNVELLRVEDGVAYLRLEGSCNGCAASTLTLKQRIEEAIYRVAPDLDDLKVEGVVEPARSGGQAMRVTFVPRKRQQNSVASTR
jgi:Fe-S cluster biogenesis protein NfuA